VINQLFGEPVERIVGETGPVANGLKLTGRYDAQTETSRGYVFSMETPGAFKMRSHVIEEIEIRKAGFSVSEFSVPMGGLVMDCLFNFWGAIKFKELKVQGGDCDILSYEKLAFEGVGLAMTFLLLIPSTKTFTFKAEGLSFDPAPGSTVPRPGSLAKRFPMRIERFVTSAQGKLPNELGYARVNTTINAQPVQLPWYGLEYTLSLGTLGDMAANAGISVQLLITWSPDPQQLKAQVWLKFPGVSGVGGDLFNLQGVIKFGASSYQLRSYGSAADTGYMLMLNSMALRVLGISIPFGGGPNVYIFGPPPGVQPPAQTSVDALGWFALYKQ
jgi:hypothetical protein